MQKDLKTVDDRTAMLTGFNNYNDTITKTQHLFNFKPKAQSLVYNKLKEPLDDEEFLGSDNELKITAFNCTGYDVTATFTGVTKGDPTPIPSKYADYLINKVKNKYGDAYFVNVTYSGFTKTNYSDFGAYGFIISEGDEQYDTVYTFNLTMRLQMGSDEEFANADDLNSIVAPAPDTTSEANSSNSTNSNTEVSR